MIYNIGVDIGSQNIYSVILRNGKFSGYFSMQHQGNIPETVKQLIHHISGKIPNPEFVKTGITGSIGRDDIPLIDSVLANIEAARITGNIHRHILSVGCERSFLINMDEKGNYTGHSAQSDCAAGTGGFIDQQAYRLGVDPEGLAEMAEKYDGPVPTIATRCAVFAKSDIIHAQAAGYSPSGIAAGLCKGMARSIVASTTQGRELDGSLVFVGGVAKNRAIVQALSDLFEQEIDVPENGVFWNAMGAAIMADRPFSDLSSLTDNSATKRNTRAPLSAADIDYPDFSADRTEIINDVEVTTYAPSESFNGEDIYLGIDVGSTSTKAVVTDKTGMVLLGVYTRTRGNPVKAVSEILARIHAIFSKTGSAIAGVATTGSGRELIKSVFGADMAINEITAHAKGATFIDSDVDTIIEIGGQDSKFTRLKNGAVTLATMNYVCAAGTGSFIEEQAMRLDITLDEIPALTLGKTAPFTSDRCTVYMERDLNTLLSEGWDKAGTMAAVLFSVRDNYLSKVVGKTPFGKCIYFQGATARNKALVAAFAAELGTNVKVSRFCHLTGALGCAVALREAGLSASDFAGTDITYTVNMEVCELCANKCDLSVYDINGRKTAWGMKCGRDFSDTGRGKQKTFSDLEAAFRQIMRPDAEKEAGGPAVALPQVVYMSEYGPLFESFLMNIGFRVKMISGSDKALKDGSRRIQADFCAPMAMVHGVILNALQSDCEYVFFPTVINAPHESENLIHPKPLSEKTEDRYFCYYSAYAPTILASAAPSEQRDRLISPKISFFRMSINEVAERLAKDLRDSMKLDPDHVKEAFVDAWKGFETRKHIWQHLGKEKLNASPDKISIMLMARPYVLFDRRLNQGIPAKLESMGFDLMIQSMTHAPEDQDNLMHWHYGQQMMSALEAVRTNPHIYPVFISCFRCSPDAYLMTEFKAQMDKMGKPYLILQLDEHGSDVGYQTRIEAAIETFATHFGTGGKIVSEKSLPRSVKGELKEGDTLLIPYTDGRINRLQQAIFRNAGYDARVMPLTSDQIHLGYRYASGGECLPNVAILGSMIDFIKKENLDPSKTMLYLPSICFACNFPQYGAMIMNGLEHAGLGGAGIISPSGLESVPGLSMRANANLLAATNIGSILHKLTFRYRPYETEPGATDKALAEAEEAVIDHIMNGKSMLNAAKAVREIVEKLPLPTERKPRIAVLGDLYAKYNDVLNERVWDLAESLGGEIFVPSYNEMLIHGIYADALEKGADTKSVSTMVKFEQRFEAVFKGLLDDQFEPTPEECHELLQKYGMDQPIPGETAISVGRTLYYAEKGLVSAIIHVNPVFCCPGVVSSAIFKRLQEETRIPVIDLFYDGTNKPNTRIIPHLYYLTKQARGI
ncbi:acyl-CoA dehydratase activase [Desulforegula conservatrix]|uniref:acyl-CoA dehydratase activase n=1 Tax=Desulforegula conservatrix TaxID=153026 RepID=UPI0004063BAF|nr:acyl-CoA dehydratase activase [Desulforegula conservatrix]